MTPLAEVVIELVSGWTGQSALNSGKYWAPVFLLPLPNQ